METTRLILTFIDASDKKVSISLDNPKSNVTEAEIKAAMELVIAKNIFVFNGAALMNTASAQIVETTKTDFDLAL